MPVFNPRLSGQSLVNLNSYNLLHRSDRREERRKHRAEKKATSEQKRKTNQKYEKCGESPKVEREKGDIFLLHHLSFKLSAILSSSV